MWRLVELAARGDSDGAGEPAAGGSADGVGVPAVQLTAPDRPVVSLELRHCTSCEDKGKFSTILFEVIQFFIVLKWLS